MESTEQKKMTRISANGKRVNKVYIDGNLVYKKFRGLRGTSYYAGDKVQLQIENHYAEWTVGTDLTWELAVPENIGDTCTLEIGGDTGNIRTIDFSWFGSTGNVYSMSGLFYYFNNLTSVNLTNFDTSNVVSMCYMFEHCESLEELDVSHFDTSYVNDMEGMFRSCSSLTELDITNFDLCECIYMNDMFSYCTSLETLALPNIPDGCNTDSMFSECYSLANISFAEGASIGSSLSFQDSPLLTDASVQNIINALADDVDGLEIVFHSDVYERLTQEQIDTIAAKGWALLEP